MRPVRTLTWIVFSFCPLALTQGQVSPPGCTPCEGPGACPGTHPISSGSKHSCENHAFDDHSGLNVSMVNLNKTSLSSGSWAGSQLIDCSLVNAHAYRTDFTGATLTDCKAAGLIAIEADFTNAVLTGVSMRNAYMPRAKFGGAQALVKFAGATLFESDFTATTLSAGPDMADFSNADLSSATGLDATVGVALYSPCTDFSGTGFDPVAAGWILGPGANIGEQYCDPAPLNSTGAPGVITALGCPDVASNSLTLVASQLPPNQFGYFLVSETQGFKANPGGSQGNLCLSGTIARYVSDIKNSGPDGSFEMAVDLTDIPPPANSSVAPGETWNFQGWYQDDNPGPTSNFTDGVSVLFY